MPGAEVSRYLQVCIPMKIFINGQDETSSFRGETLGDVLDQIQKKIIAEGRSITRLLVDNAEGSMDSVKVRKTLVSQVGILEIGVASLSEVISRNIANAEEYLGKLVPGIERAAELFRNGSEQEANQFFLQIIDGMDWFSQVIEMITQAKPMDPTSPLFGGESIEDRQNRLFELTKQMVEANKSRDWVLLADLLEYELLPFYEQWAETLPELNKPN